MSAHHTTATQIHPGSAYSCSSFLIVDDDDIARERLRQMLESQSHRVSGSAHGSHALQVLKWFDPDVVLVNVASDGSSAHELARRIRSLPLGDIYTLVAMGQDPDELAGNTDFDLFVNRPKSYSELIALLDELDQAWSVRPAMAGQAQIA